MESRISMVLSSLINSRLQTGLASTVIPTAAGMAISREKRMEVAIRSSFSLLFLFATALVRMVSERMKGHWKQPPVC